MKLGMPLVALLPLWLPAQELKKASIGDLPLKDGQIIRDCQIAYRTFGHLNGTQSNAVLFPTWFTGTTKELANLIGPGKLVDSPGSYIIAVDALGDGVSSSASNSKSQPHMRFPKFSIRDMVELQHRLLTQVLHLTHLHAVIGISMGGMQTFQWITAYPDFMDLAIPLVGSPKLTSFDLLLWNSEARAIETDPTWASGEYTAIPRSMSVVADIHALALNNPDQWVQNTSPQQFLKTFEAMEATAGHDFNSNDWLRQLQAMMGQDFFKGFNGESLKASRAVHAKLVVIVAANDHMVNPHPALAFAKLLNAQIIELIGACGHTAAGCEADKIRKPISSFLAQ